VVEHLGAERFVYVRVGESLLTARLDGRGTTVEGEEASFEIETKEVHLFDREGSNLLFDGEAR
jgi:ABC-type sugar transport system ATPase subunit